MDGVAAYPPIHLPEVNGSLDKMQKVCDVPIAVDGASVRISTRASVHVAIDHDIF